MSANFALLSICPTVDFVVSGSIHIWLDQGELFRMMIKKQYWDIGRPSFGEDCREIEVFDKGR